LKNTGGPIVTINTSSARVLILFDNANLLSSLQNLRIQLNFSKTLRYIKKRFGKVVFAKCYMDKDEFESPGKKSLISLLKRLGVTIYKKQPKHVTIGGITIMRCDVDAVIVADMFDRMDDYDILIIFSGDKDYVYAIQLLQNKGKHVVAVSISEDASESLIQTCDEYIDLREIANEIML